MPYPYPVTAEKPSYEAFQVLLRRALVRVFCWMGLGILLTALAAAAMRELNFVSQLSRPWMLGLLIGQMVMVLLFSQAVVRARPWTLALMFIVYSLSMGVTTSLFLQRYTHASIVNGFLLSAAVFLVMAVYGTVTKKDLSGVGTLGYMLLFGAILVTLLNFFFRSSMLNGLLNYCILAIFVGLTAYHIQKIRRDLGEVVSRQVVDQTLLRKLTLSYALTLYLNFINIFLRILGLRNHD